MLNKKRFLALFVLAASTVGALAEEVEKESAEMAMQEGEMPMMTEPMGGMSPSAAQPYGGYGTQGGWSGMPMGPCHKPRMGNRYPPRGSAMQQGSPRGMGMGPCYRQPMGMMQEQGATAYRQGQSAYAPMMMGGRGMMDPERMREWQEGMAQHMHAMQQHMANIEALLRELVELEKAR